MSTSLQRPIDAEALIEDIIAATRRLPNKAAFCRQYGISSFSLDSFIARRRQPGLHWIAELDQALHDYAQQRDAA